MAKRAEFEIPAGLQELARQFEQWRSSHSGRRPIPEALWLRAADLAREHGVFRTAKVLRLDFSKLKRKMAPAQGRQMRRPPHLPHSSSFSLHRRPPGVNA